MQKLIIDNFLNIKHAELDLKDFVVLIGPQASGKSVAAKLTYFFKNIFFENIMGSVIKEESYDAFKKKIELRFKEYFPEYSWEKTNFNIKYICNNMKIEVKKNKILKISYGETTEEFFTELQKSFIVVKKETEKAMEKDENKPFPLPKYIILERYLEKYIKDIINTFSFSEFEKTYFIPAGRSFFSNLKQNVFSFLSNNIEIDPFLKIFGADFERVKNIYNIRKYPKPLIQIDQIINEILNGKYRNKNNEDWIESNNFSIKVINSSSGQQESLPMLLVLSFFPYVRQHTYTNRNIFFIEEPEAHLFPVSQKKIIELLALTYNITESKNSFFLTTHSPYILTAMNNLILADKALKKTKDKKIKEKYENKTIHFDSVSAYAVKDGVFNSIMDKEEEMINGEYIDKVSEEVGKELSELLDIVYE